MELAEYLKPISEVTCRKEQKDWFGDLKRRVTKGLELYESLGDGGRESIWNEFNNLVRTEELKSWYGAPEGESLFQGTSISSLTIPHITSEPLQLSTIHDLENEIAEAYIKHHYKHVNQVRGAILENIDEWIGQGLYYGVVIGAKVISQAFGLSIASEDVILDVEGHRVDPHEITTHPAEVREAYFNECQKRITCFKGLDLEQREFESSLVLSDISKPKLSEYKDKIILAPLRCNEIANRLSERVVEKIINNSKGEIRPKGLVVVIYDSDTPYTYHAIMGYSKKSLSPVLPGLTVLGATGTFDAFRWLYAYRVSLISQKIQKGSLFSEIHKTFFPFVFMGVLVWRDAEILLDMDNLSNLRYRGNLSPDLEFANLIPQLYKSVIGEQSSFSWKKFNKLHSISD